MRKNFSLRKLTSIFAVTSPDPSVPAAHLGKLVALGYVALTEKGPVVTGDGLIRITESE